MKQISIYDLYTLTANQSKEEIDTPQEHKLDQNVSPGVAPSVQKANQRYTENTNFHEIIREMTDEDMLNISITPENQKSLFDSILN